MAPSPGEQSALSDTITSTLGLVTQFVSSLVASQSEHTRASKADKTIEDPPNPLLVLRDSASLMKAHVTKVSLLAINKPFTPSAVTKVVKELSGTCLPAMMGAVQICEQEQDTCSAFMSKEVQARVRRVFLEIEALLQEVQSVAHGNTSSARRDSLASTGVVWESCDALIELEKLGIAGLAVQKAEQCRDTIKDAISELKEWMEGDDVDNEGQKDELLDSDDEGVEGDRDSIEDIFNAANSMPSDRPALKSLVEDAVEMLKKVVILYNAVIKRRLKNFKAVPAGNSESSAMYLDRTIAHLKRMPHMADELASAFYDLDEQLAQAVLDKLVNEASACGTSVERSYDGKEDEFTSWTKKWQEAIVAKPSISKG